MPNFESAFRGGRWLTISVSLFITSLKPIHEYQSVFHLMPHCNLFDTVHKTPSVLES